MRILALLLSFSFLAVSASALEIEAPRVPESGQKWMPKETSSFADGFCELLRKAVSNLRPDLQEASRVSLGILAAVLMISVLHSFSSSVKRASEAAGTVTIATLLLLSTNSMVCLASDTVLEIGAYGKLLLPVMTAALAAQGGISGSAALYAGTSLFLSLLQAVLGNLLVPGIFLYIILCIGNSATGEEFLKKMGDMLKSFLSWCLKILLMVFTTYLSLTGVVSGTTDAAALKAAKVSMSSFVPVVGGVLSDASEAVLVSAGLLKNTAGIYGILAVLALFLHPFLQIGIHYLILKITCAVCTVFGNSRVTGIIDSFSTAMGLLLGMTASACVMVLISTVCFMKGVV